MAAISAASDFAEGLPEEQAAADLSRDDEHRRSC
jgi:hypothetical protein